MANTKKTDAKNAKQHGGMRANAGRKPTGRKPYLIYINPKAWSEFVKDANVNGCKIPGEFIERMYPEK